MTTVFIGGSRHIKSLNDAIRARLDNIIEKSLSVVIGDANGADLAVQTYFAARNYANVVVYFMEGVCRNNAGNWPAKGIGANGKRGFEYYSLKDAEMAGAADCGLMLWDGKSRGTFANIVRLVKSSKPLVVFLSPQTECKTILGTKDVYELIELVSPTERPRLLGMFSRPDERPGIDYSKERHDWVDATTMSQIEDAVAARQSRKHEET